MDYFSFNIEDYPKSSWILHDIVKLLPKRAPHPEVPPVFYKFFPAPDVEARMKPQYLHLCCKKCGRYDTDKVFDLGFTDPVTLRFKGDYGYTRERMFVISDKFLKALKQAKVRGYETKPLGKSGWHALRPTLLIDHADGVIKSVKPLCPECGRPKENYGAFHYRNQLSLPTQTNTFFTPKTIWPSYKLSDRSIFITEDVFQILKAAGIAGGYCTRLWSEEERKKQKEKAKQGIPFWRPPKTAIPLNGKPSKK